METENSFLKAELIALNKKNLSQCFELDQVALNGLWSKSQWEYELSSSSRMCIGVKRESKIVSLACGSLAKEMLDITFVAVHPSFRRQGYAKFVLSTLLIKAKESLVNNAILEVNEQNIAALNLYKNLGFKEVSIREKYYKNRFNARVMLKKI